MARHRKLMLAFASVGAMALCVVASITVSRMSIDFPASTNAANALTASDVTETQEVQATDEHTDVNRDVTDVEAPAAPHVTQAQGHITEDDPRWDCQTMGNKVCGNDVTTSSVRLPTQKQGASPVVITETQTVTATETVVPDNYTPSPELLRSICNQVIARAIGVNAAYNCGGFVQLYLQNKLPPLEHTQQPAPEQTRLPVDPTCPKGEERNDRICVGE